MDASRKIENLIYTYAERMDAGDLEGVAELFRDAELRTPAQDSGAIGYDQVLAVYQAATRIYQDNGTPKTKHLTTNVIVDVNGEQAESRAYFTVIQATDKLSLQPIIAGRYHDFFVCEEDQWRFASRSITVDHMGDCSAHLLSSFTGLSSPGID